MARRFSRRRDVWGGPIPGDTLLSPRPGLAGRSLDDLMPEPAEATPEPGEATPEPSGATPEPAEATPEPGEATPEPSGATPEPAEATPEPRGAAGASQAAEPAAAEPGGPDGAQAADPAGESAEPGGPDGAQAADPAATEPGDGGRQPEPAPVREPVLVASVTELPPLTAEAAPVWNSQPESGRRDLMVMAMADADTVVLPLVRQMREAANGNGQADAVVWPGLDGPTEVMPVLVPLEVEEGTLERLYAPSRRRTWLSRGILLIILCTQALLSLRLRNTAFEDEAQYLYAGRLELAHLLHGTPVPVNFTSYFSGSPVLYPVLAGAANDVGGLAAARAVSLAEMLATTALLYMLTRRLFNERAGLGAAALFSAEMSLIFMGNFATYDATALFLLALAAWIGVRTAGSRWPLFLLAAPVAALAVATKYAALLFVPTIVLMPAFAGWPRLGRRALFYPLALGASIALLLAAALRLGGPAYMHAISSTTTARAQGGTPVTTILMESLKWGGVLFAVAVFGTVAYAWRPRTERGERIAPPGSRLRRVTMGVVLTGAALLAPAYQAHIHTDTSFQKHIGFGLFFAAPMAGVGLARIIGDHFRRPQFGLAVWGLVLALGITQSGQFFGSWPNSQGLTQVMARYLRPRALYLVEAPEVPEYYLENRPDAQPRQFLSTAGLSIVTKGKRLSGAAAFKFTIRQGWYQIVAYDGVTSPATAQMLRQDLKGAPYTLKKVVSGSTHGHVYNYYVWVKLSAAELQRIREQKLRQQKHAKQASRPGASPAKSAAPIVTVPRR
jgi:Dolichyl-phosphate-mannose-protein mannosyltransferase